MLQQIKNKLSMAILLLGGLTVVMLASATPAYAANVANTSVQTIGVAATELDTVGGSVAARKQINCKRDKGEPGGSHLTTQRCGILKFIAVATNVLTGIAATVIVIMVIVGGIQYSSAGANPQAVSAAKGKVRNAMLALFILVFFYSFLQWLIPGGVFR